MNASTMFKVFLMGLFLAIASAVLLALGYAQLKWGVVAGILLGAGSIACGAAMNAAGLLKNDMKRRLK
jgi:hypothetical protein